MKQEIPVIRGQKYQIKISSLGHSGEGVGRYKDFTVFVPCALPGEEVEVYIEQVKKTYAKGKLTKIITPSNNRVEPKCPIYIECGGCQLQHLDYQGQLQVKTQQVIDAIQRIGKQDAIIHDTIGAEEPWFYRNKMQFPVGKRNDDVIIGCYAQGTHRIIDTPNCLIQKQENNKIVQAVKKVLTELKIPPYDEKSGKGVIRHVIGRVGSASGEVMVVLVINGTHLHKKEHLVTALRLEIPKLVCIAQNINTANTNVIMGHKTEVLWGKETITDKIGDFEFNISAKSFFQVNTKQAEVLYKKALEYADLQGNETVIDAYCGTGTISLFLAQKAKKVYGIEMVKPAVINAKENAKNNNVKNVEFIIGDTVEVMPKLYKEGIKPDVIVVDPPRAGCEKSVLETFAQMNPNKIVYVSCNPASLARDIANLAEHNYQAIQIQPVDMFSQTSHVESIALLRRKISENP